MKKANLADAWKNPDHVITNGFGNYVDPNLVSAWFSKARKMAGIKRKLTLHDVRHFYSSFLARIGVSEKTISELMGHSDPSFTNETYIHIFDDSTIQAARTFEKAIELEESESQYD